MRTQHVVTIKKPVCTAYMYCVRCNIAYMYCVRCRIAYMYYVRNSFAYMYCVRYNFAYMYCVRYSLQLYLPRYIKLVLKWGDLDVGEGVEIFSHQPPSILVSDWSASQHAGL